MSLKAEQVTAIAPPGGAGWGGVLGRHLGRLRDYMVALTLLALFVGLSLGTSTFFTSQNLKNVLDQTTALGIIACAGTLVIIAGGFDLSAGAIFALSGVIAAEVALHWSPIPGLLVGIVAGAFFGLGNGILVSVVRVNPFIATLGSSILIGGIALLITNGNLISLDPSSSFLSLGSGDFAGVKYSIWIWLGVALVLSIVLWGTTLGRYIYASGGNEEAARFSGVRVGMVRTITFVLSGLAASFAGVLSASRIGTGQADANSGVGIELTAVAAIVVGGTSIRGGEGAIWRTIVGVLLLGIIGNGFNLLGLDPVYQNIVYGGIILIAAGIDALLRRNAS